MSWCLEGAAELFADQPTFAVHSPWSLLIYRHSSDSETVNTLTTKLRELNKKVADVQREQRYLREVEATFRDTSEATNSRAVWWSICQIIILVAVAGWQMRHLKVYFDDKKLR